MGKKKKKVKQKVETKKYKVKQKSTVKKPKKNKGPKIGTKEKRIKKVTIQKEPKVKITTKKRKASSVKNIKIKQLVFRLKRMVIPVSVALAVFVILFFVVGSYKVQTVHVSGNIHYSDEEITDMVTEGHLGKNTAYLFLKYRNKEIKNIPFIETMSVSIENPTTIRINVYEKSLAGYVDYLDRHMYFDRDGYVVESSDVLTEGIPQVVGLNFDHLILYEKLPVENDDIFQEILSITQLLNKFSLSADRICFDTDYDLSLYFGQVKVIIGDNQSIDEKIMVLPDILPKLEGKNGVLNLENYRKGDTITFESADNSM